MTTKFCISWQEFHSDTKQLVEKIKAAGTFNRIVAVSRGGLIPAGIIAYELNIRNCETINMSSYEADGTRRPDDKIELRANLDNIDSQTLIIDDLSDTGRTYKILRGLFPQAKFVTVYSKAAGVSEVDIYARLMPDQWIEFPWDI